MINQSIISMCGVPGAGKTTIATKLRQELDVIVLSPAMFRTTHVPLSVSESQIVDNEWYGAAEEYLRNGKSVVMDATFHKRIKREKLYRFSERLKSDLLFIHCVCNPQTAIKRLKYQEAIGQKTFYCDVSEMVLAYSSTYEDICQDPQKPTILEYNTETRELRKYNYSESESLKQIIELLSK